MFLQRRVALFGLVIGGLYLFFWLYRVVMLLLMNHSMYIPFEARPDFIMLLALSNVIVGRAVFVPCTGRWTLTLGLIVGAVLLTCVYYGSLDLDMHKRGSWVTGRYCGIEWFVIYPELTDQTARSLAAAITTEIAIWWVLATALSTGASVVIYGLRRRVRDALSPWGPL